MTLYAETSRIPTQRLVELTNPLDTAPSAVDATRLQQACDDAEGWFLTATGMAYDVATGAAMLASNPAAVKAAVAAAVAAVVATLYDYRGLPGDDQATRSWTTAKARASAFARQVGSLRWTSPATDSNLVPTASPAVPPATDPSRIDPFLPQIQAGGGGLFPL